MGSHRRRGPSLGRRCLGHVTRQWRRGGVLIVALLVASCSSTGGQAKAEEQLLGGFIDPLAGAGLAVEVTRTCHYLPRSGPGKRTLAATMAVDADAVRVADVLTAEDMVVEDRIDYVVIQQFRGQPSRGWSGGMEPHGDDVSIDVVKNDVDVSGRLDLAWMPVCPESAPD